MALDDMFHEHLDVCKQCADHPFDLCPVGLQLIEVAARTIVRPVGEPFGLDLRRELECFLCDMGLPKKKANQ